jgi:hypothetical protein
MFHRIGFKRRVFEAVMGSDFHTGQVISLNVLKETSELRQPFERDQIGS